MLKKYLKYALSLGYIGLIVFVAVVVPLSGVNTAQRLFESCEPEADEGQRPQPLHAEINRTPGVPDEAPDNMAPSGPSSEQPAYISNSFLVKTSESERSSSGLDQVTEAGQIGTDESDNLELATTISQVDSHLGHQFTLLGSKPSGTS